MKATWRRAALLCALLFALACVAFVGTALAENTLTLPTGVTAVEAETFEGVRNVDRIDMPGSVTSIGAGAFRNCGKPTAELRYYFLPAGVNVAEGAFEGCRVSLRIDGSELPCLRYSVGEAGVTITGMSGQLAEVDIPDAIDGKPVVAIGNGVFNGRRDITRVAIPPTVTSIGENAFRGCYGLTNIDLPEGLTSLGGGAFRDCQALTGISIPAGITALPNETFWGCYALADIDLPEGLATLGNGVFFGCRALTQIDLPAGVTALPKESFWGCYTLANIDLNGITSLGESVFRDCRALTEVTIPSGIEEIPASAFEGATGLTRVHLPDTLTAVKNSAFYNCGALTEISIPAGVTEIPRGCFQGCVVLQSVQLPAGTESIGQNAFRSCTALTMINFPSSLTSIGQEAFRETCVGQPDNAVYVLPDSVTIGSDAFYRCGAGLLVEKNSDRESFVKANGYTFAYNANDGFRYQYRKVDNVDTLYLTGYKGAGGNVNIPEGPVVIGEEAFANNTAVTGATIPAGVTLIDRRAFRYCTSLTAVAMADSVTEIGDGAFAYCAKLTNVAFPASLQRIGGDAFAYACTAEGVHLFNLPDHIAALGGRPFNECGAVPCFNRGSDTATLFMQNQYIYTYNGETDFRYRWYNGEGTEGHQERLVQYVGNAATVSIPGYVWMIGDNSFKDNASVTKVVIPEGVTHIANCAFQGCANLTDITLPASLYEVRDNAFYSCGSAAAANFTLNLPSNVENIMRDAFTAERMILVCDMASTTAERLSDRGYAFVRADRPNELDFRYKWEFYNHAWSCGLYDYVGPLTSVRVPDDCANVSSTVLRTKINNGLELVCSQLSTTAEGISRSEMNFTFPGHEGLRYRIIDGVLNLMGCVGSPAELVIPRADAYINAGWEEYVNAQAFENMTTLTRVVLPEGMVRVKDKAFLGCVNLTDVTLPVSLRVLENHAFEKCGKNADALHYYVLPDNMTDVATNTDAGWGAFTDINLGRVSCNPGTSTALQLSGIDPNYNHGGSYRFALVGHEADGLLYRCDQFTINSELVPRLVLKTYEGSDSSVAIPSGTGLYRIEDRVFENRQTLQQVTMPDDLVEIGEYAFSECSLLHGGAEEFVIQVPGTVKRIRKNAFYKGGNGYTSDRFYLVLPGTLDEFDISAVTGCNAVLVAPGGLAEQVLYDSWYYYYPTLADAKAKTNLRYKRAYDEQGIEIEHAHYGQQ